MFFFGFSLSVNTRPCEGKVSWDDYCLMFDYGNDVTGELEITDYRVNSMKDLFVISAMSQGGSVVELSIQDHILSYLVT